MPENESEQFIKTKSILDYYNTKDKSKFIYKELVIDSNAIEGIFSKEETIETICEDSIERYKQIDHIKAYEYVINNHTNNLNTKEILKLHSILMNNIFRIENKNIAGEYRKNKVYVGPKYGLQKGATHFKLISKATDMLEKDITELDNKMQNYNAIKKTNIINNYEDILKIHNDFETIHPFNDGNGRTGRLILNWLSLKYFDEFIIIDSNKKKEYYEHINNNRQIYFTKHPKINFYKDRIVKKTTISDASLEAFLNSPFMNK